MEIPEIILIPGGVIIGVALIYFLFLKCAHNAWIGRIPPGPRTLAGLGCVHIYLSTSHIQELIHTYFKEYGWIFQLRSGLQKVVFIQHKDELLEALKKQEIIPTTIRDLVTALRELGMSRFKRRELLFLQNVWSAHAHTFKAVKGDAGLVRTIASKILSEDVKESQSVGLIAASPAQLDTPRVSDEFEEEALMKAKTAEENLAKLRTILLDHSHILMSSFYGHTVGRTAELKRVREEGAICYQQIKGYLHDLLAAQNVYTEKRFLVLLYLLVKMAATGTPPPCQDGGQDKMAAKSDLGPDVAGWRSFTCQKYARVADYDIPKNTNIYALRIREDE